MALRIQSLIALVCLSVMIGCSNGSTTEKVEETGSDKPFTMEDAKAVFTFRCTSCHGDDGKLGLSGAKDLSISKLSDQEILTLLQDGKNTMPSFKELIPVDQQDSLVAYIKTLRK